MQTKDKIHSKFIPVAGTVAQWHSPHVHRIRMDLIEIWLFGDKGMTAPRRILINVSKPSSTQHLTDN